MEANGGHTKAAAALITNFSTSVILNNLSSITDNRTDPETECNYSRHSWLEAKLILISICGSVVAAFGIFGNLTTALILTRPSMRSPNNLYLTALAVFDTCLLVTAILIYSVEYIVEFTDNFQMYVAWLTYLRFCFALSHISQTGSVYTTVAVTIERYLAVCHPNRARIACTKRGASVSILGVTCFAILFNCTKFFELEIRREPGCPRFSAYKLQAGPLTGTVSYQLVYSLWMSNIVMVFLPFITLLVFNSVIAWTIRKSLAHMTFDERYHQRNELKEKSRDATRVLIIIVLMFLICNIWGFVITLLEVIYGIPYLYINWSKFYAFSREAINFLAMVNSSINFVIYIIFGKDFRKELITVYGCTGGITLSLPTEDKFSNWRIGKSIRRRISNPQSFIKVRLPGKLGLSNSRQTDRTTEYEANNDTQYGRSPSTPSITMLRNSNSALQPLSTTDENLTTGPLLSVPKPHWLANGDVKSAHEWDHPRSPTKPEISKFIDEDFFANALISPTNYEQPNGHVNRGNKRFGSISCFDDDESVVPKSSSIIEIVELEPLSPYSENSDETIWL